MDVGSEQVLVVMADKKENGQIRILGGGEAPVRGLKNGDLADIGDLVESIAEAAAKSEKSSGVSIGKLYYNMDDSRIESVWSSGSKILDGEGEIQTADVRAAAQAAERIAGNFEKKIAYSTEVEYVIDGNDPVENPVGVFGHKLDVKVHLLLTRADRWDAWERLVRRAGFPRSTAVLSGLSSAYGVLSPQEQMDKKIVWDIGKDYLNGLLMEGGRIHEYRTLLREEDSWGAFSGVLPALCQEFQKKHSGISEVVLTGESAGDEKFFLELQAGVDIPVRIALPLGIVKLSEPRHASFAGLLRLAGEVERKSVTLRPEKSALVNARNTVKSFLSDYF